ncbi:MAG: hypothetical protein ACP5N2_01200 [Candidatus Nanoarchaeia archaeon]
MLKITMIQKKETHNYEMRLTIPWKYVPGLLEDTKTIVETNLDQLHAKGIASIVEVQIDGMDPVQSGLAGLVMPDKTPTKKNTFDNYRSKSLESATANIPKVYSIIGALVAFANDQKVDQQIMMKSMNGDDATMQVLVKQDLNNADSETCIFGITMHCKGRYSPLGSDLFNYMINKRQDIKTKTKQEVPTVLKYS